MNRQNINLEDFDLQEFMEQCSQCYIFLQKYKLKTNIVGLNMSKQNINFSYDYLQKRLTDRYAIIEQKLLQGVKKLHKNFLVAKGNALRSVNNVFCNYRKRVGLLSNDPLTPLKYNKYVIQQKALLQAMLFNDVDSIQQINSLKVRLQKDLQQSIKQIQQKYKINQKIKQKTEKIFQIIDKSQCHAYKYYQNFQRSMVLTLSNWQANFDKLNAFLSVFQNEASIKAFQIKSQKQLQFDMKNPERDRKEKYNFEYESEQYLQYLLSKYPPHSAMRDQIKKRITQLKRVSGQKQKKVDDYGRMYNKRKNRPGILVNKNKDVQVIDYFEDIDGQKKYFNHKTEFRINQNNISNGQYKLTQYQLHKSFKNVQEIKNHLQKSHKGQNLNNEWHFDRFGRYPLFNVITGFSQQIQKKIQFQCIRQQLYIQKDDLHKRELAQTAQSNLQQNKRKQTNFIGFKRLTDRHQLEELNRTKYSAQYTPMDIQSDDQELQFSSDQQLDRKNVKTNKTQKIQANDNQLKEKKIINLTLFEDQDVKMESINQIQQKTNVKINTIDENHQNKSTLQILHTKNITENHMADQQLIDSSEQQNQDDCLPKEIINKYFRQYSRKIVRKQTDTDYKKTYFFYYDNYKNISTQQVSKHQDFQNLFIVTMNQVILVNKIFSNVQKIKCYVYLIQKGQQDDRQTQIRSIIKNIYKNMILTVKFQQVNIQSLSQQRLLFFVIGFVSILIKFSNMPQDLELNDYILQGKQIVQDFKLYYYPQEYELQRQKLNKKFRSFAPSHIFAPLKKKQVKPQTLQSTKIETKDKDSNSQKIKIDVQNQQIHKVDVDSSKQQQIQQIPQTHLNLIQGDKVDSFQLKRSDSREKISSMNVQQQIYSLKRQNNDGQQQDYDAL